jgi:hypothetical protein
MLADTKAKTVTNKLPQLTVLGAVISHAEFLSLFRDIHLYLEVLHPLS